MEYTIKINKLFVIRWIYKISVWAIAFSIIQYFIADITLPLLIIILIVVIASNINIQIKRVFK